MAWDVISRFLFPAPPATYSADSFPEELIFVPKDLEQGDRCPAAQCVPCLFLPYPSARFLIFYLHSNAEDLGKCYSFCSVVREQFQVHVLAVEYPGYGICPGGPANEDNVTENVFAVFRFVREVLQWPMDSIKIFGRSIGTGPAISLSVQYKVSGLILVAPFLSIKELLKDSVGFLSHLIDERFPNKDRIHLIRSPVLIVHGRKDALIPCRHGITLYELGRSRKLLVCPEDMEHNTNILTDVGFLVLPMLQFFSLPDYCFEDIKVPPWVFDKRLSMQYQGQPRGVCSIHSSINAPLKMPQGDGPLNLEDDTDPGIYEEEQLEGTQRACVPTSVPDGSAPRKSASGRAVTDGPNGPVAAPTGAAWEDLEPEDAVLAHLEDNVAYVVDQLFERRSREGREGANAASPSVSSILQEPARPPRQEPKGNGGSRSKGVTSAPSATQDAKWGPRPPPTKQNGMRV